MNVTPFILDNLCRCRFDLFLGIGLLSTHALAEGTDVRIQKDISFLPRGATVDDYTEEQCKLDLYLPTELSKRFPLMVWFHGGGLKGGSRASGLTVRLARGLASRGVGVALADYRLNPQVGFPAYIQDAALAVRWAVVNAESLGASTEVFVGGHSAGGYIACMLAMDSRYLENVGVGKDDLAGFISMSGQTMTHFTVAEERGISSTVITADEAAPIHYLKSETPPILLLVGDRDWPARLEENAFFVSSLRKVGKNPNVTLQVIPERDHSSILKHAAEFGDPAGDTMLDFLKTRELPENGASVLGIDSSSKVPESETE